MRFPKGLCFGLWGHKMVVLNSKSEGSHFLCVHVRVQDKESAGPGANCRV